MVLSITGAIKKGDPDFEPLQQIYKKVAQKNLTLLLKRLK
jgi:hypothetical protein